MRFARPGFIAALLVAGATVAGGATAQTPGVVEGLWINPHRSVAVRTGACGDRMCGWIVWATPEARKDASDGGVAQLIGTALLEEYRAQSPGHWAGTVFVPDMNRRFSSQIDLVSPTQLKVKGCILGGLFCKSQLWTRIDRVPQ